MEEKTRNVTVLYQMHTRSGTVDLRRSFTVLAPDNIKRLFDIVEQRQGVDILTYRLDRSERLKIRDRKLKRKNRE